MFHGKDVLQALSGRETLLDAVVSEVKITESGGDPLLSIRFRLDRRSRFSVAEVTFSEILDFDIAWDDSLVFGNVESYKFCQLADAEFYLSLDPNADTSPEVLGIAAMTSDSQDGFYVRAKMVHLTLFP